MKNEITRGSMAQGKKRYDKTSKLINLIRSSKVFVEIEIKTMTLIYGVYKLILN